MEVRAFVVAWPIFLMIGMTELGGAIKLDGVPMQVELGHLMNQLEQLRSFVAISVRHGFCL